MLFINRKVWPKVPFTVQTHMNIMDMYITLTTLDFVRLKISLDVFLPFKVGSVKAQFILYAEMYGFYYNITHKTSGIKVLQNAAKGDAINNI